MSKGFRAIAIIFIFIVVVAFLVSFFRNTINKEDIEDLRATRIIEALALLKREAPNHLSGAEQENLKNFMPVTLKVFKKYLSKTDFLELNKIINKYKMPKQLLKGDVEQILKFWNQLLLRVSLDDKKQLIGHVSLLQKVVPDPTLGQSIVCLLFANPL